MRQLCFKHHRLPADIIRHSIWLYAKFTLELPRCRGEARRAGPGQSYETVRNWFLKFGPVIAANLRRTRPRPGDHWRLDEIKAARRQSRAKVDEEAAREAGLRTEPGDYRQASVLPGSLPSHRPCGRA